MAKLSAKRKKLIREILMLAKTKLYSKPSDVRQTMRLYDCSHWSHKKVRNICVAVGCASHILIVTAESDSRRREITIANNFISNYIKDSLGGGYGYVEEWLLDNGYIPAGSYVSLDALYREPATHDLAVRIIEYRKAWVDHMINEVFV